MNPIGIIAEFNPFHVGHEYLIQHTKKIYPMAPIIICMSGNFVQRGEPAITDKWLRAEMAIKCGADIVFELPTIFAASSADLFATGGIKLLFATGLVKDIICGAESTDISILNDLSQVIDNEAFKNHFKKKNHMGLSHADSFAKACVAAASENSFIATTRIDSYEQALSHPNNLLAIHYLKALRNHAPELTLHAIERINNISASEIRRRIINGDRTMQLKNISAYLPQESFKLLQTAYTKNKLLVNDTALWHILRHILLTTPPTILAQTGDISEGLEHRIIHACNEATTMQEAIELIKTKRYTRTRIQRCLMQLLLGITKNDIRDAYAFGPSYLRVLGCSENGMQLLHDIKKTCSIPLITRCGRKYLFKHMESLSNPAVKRQLNLDLSASNIYTNLLPGKQISANSDSRKTIFKHTANKTTN